MSGGPSLPTASTTRKLGNATGILTQVVPKKWVPFVRFLVIAVRARAMAIAACLCLEGAVVDTCGIGRLRATGVELAFASDF